MAVPGAPTGDGTLDTTRTCLQGLYYGQWKLGRYFVQGDERLLAERVDVDADLELYDTAADPHEMRNLAHDAAHRAVRDDMVRRLAAALAREVGDVPSREPLTTTAGKS
jgi:hypothetical protein